MAHDLWVIVLFAGRMQSSGPRKAAAAVKPNYMQNSYDAGERGREDADRPFILRLLYKSNPLEGPPKAKAERKLHYITKLATHAHRLSPTSSLSRLVPRP